MSILFLKKKQRKLKTFLKRYPSRFCIAKALKDPININFSPNPLDKKPEAIALPAFNNSTELIASIKLIDKYKKGESLTLDELALINKENLADLYFATIDANKTVDFESFDCQKGSVIKVIFVLANDKQKKNQHVAEVINSLPETSTYVLYFLVLQNQSKTTISDVMDSLRNIFFIKTVAFLVPETVYLQKIQFKQIFPAPFNKIIGLKLMGFRIEVVYLQPLSNQAVPHGVCY